MTITAYDIHRVGSMVTVIVTSDLAAEDVTVYYHWYLYGAYVGFTVLSARAFYLAPGDTARIECVDALSVSFDPIANGPLGYPPRRTLFWIRSAVDDVAEYKIEQLKTGDDWVEIGRVTASEAWSYTFLTPRLDDLAEYTWRITPIDTAGNEGSTLTIGPETVVRRPDAPNFTATFSEATSQVTFAEAS